MKTDSLKLFDMIWADEEITGCRPLRRAWGDEEIFLDHWGLYDQVFNARPPGSISSSDLQQPETEGTFLLLRSEHVDQIIKSLNRHSAELSVITREQISTLEKWKSLSLANHQYMVAYIFSDGRSMTRELTRPATNAAINTAADEQSPAVEGTPRWTKVDLESPDGFGKTRRLEVKTGKLQFTMFVLLGFFMVPLGLLILIGELQKGSRLVPALVLVGLLPLAAFGTVAWLFRRAYIKSVRYFSDEGVVLNSGKSLAWTDLSRVVDRIRLNRVTNFKAVWRTELHFKNGESAWVLPTKVSNYREVSEFVRSLPCEHTETRV
jgi:hypothetical protein